jgi:hypothetical protein
MTVTHSGIIDLDCLIALIAIPRPIAELPIETRSTRNPTIAAGRRARATILAISFSPNAKSYAPSLSPGASATSTPWLTQARIPFLEANFRSR